MRSTICLAAAVLLAAPAAAKTESAYTKLMTEGAGCTVIDANEEEGWSTSRCPGYGGVPVFVSEGDLRLMVSYGWNAKAEIAAAQTFPLFNTIGETLEWRLRDGKPFATILRWKIDGGPDMPRGEVLVVTQLDEGNQCWVATVNASRNKNANELARKAADELAGTVTCDGSQAPAIGVSDPDLGQ
jgi:hypothetical protein